MAIRGQKGEAVRVDVVEEGVVAIATGKRQRLRSKKTRSMILKISAGIQMPPRTQQPFLEVLQRSKPIVTTMRAKIVLGVGQVVVAVDAGVVEDAGGVIGTRLARKWIAMILSPIDLIRTPRQTNLMILVTPDRADEVRETARIAPNRAENVNAWRIFQLGTMPLLA